jgi:2-polyprenyl-3-methyl-5-hydroxy-6-metoxy-1,4-benzoquinol methylase
VTPEQRLQRKNAFDASLTVGARAFNLATGRDAHLERRRVYKDQLIEANTQSLKAGIGVQRRCPVCGAGADRARTLFMKDGFPHLRCLECSMTYVSPILNQQRLHSHYLDETSYTSVLLNGMNRALDEKRFQYCLDVLDQFVSPPGRLLDIGCGPGTFLTVAKARGWAVQGVEFNKACVAALRRSGIDVVEVPLEQAQLEAGTYRCVALWDVLEHIAGAADFLASIHSLLSPDGILMIEVPQIDSLVSRVLHEKSATFAGDAHINFFNLATLTRLLEQNGFVVKEAETLLTELGAIANHFGFEDPYLGEAAVVVDCLTPKYIHDHLLGARLFALAAIRP